MNPLLFLLLAGGICAGITTWQQQAINRGRAAIARLSDQIVQTRNSLTVEQASLAAATARLNQLQANLQSARNEHAAATAVPLAPPTPEQEGWWPKGRPYFYLAKKYLPNVRFHDRPLETEVEAKPQSAQQAVFLTYRLFNDGALNPHLAALLGMTDEEVVTVNDIYADLVHGVREVEAARVVRVDPPEPAGPGAEIVARLPVLSSEIQPLKDHWEQALEQALGAARTGILRNLAAQYFDENLDKLGAEPREFLRTGGAGLNIRYTDAWGNHSFAATTFNLISNRDADWEYSHLFGPGAPCELK